jgi:photosystem II stability/assembly factor-like uncharacterized protein
MKHVLLIVIALQWCAFNVACASSGSQVSQKAAPEKPADHLKWSDSEWSLTPVAQLQSAGDSPRRLRCNKNALCWSWDDDSVWVSTNDDRWRLFHHAEEQIYGVYLQSATSGWIAKDRILYKTDDGGATLKQIFPTSGVQDVLISSVYFADENQGWAGGAKLEQIRKDDPVINTDIDRNRLRISQIYETRDGGQTWSEARLPRFSGFLDELTFSEKGIGIAGTRRNLVFTNGGANWIDFQKYFPKVDENERGNFLSAFFSDDRGWLLFAGFEFEVWQTADKGGSWKKSVWHIESKSTDTASRPPAPRFLFVDERHGLFLYNHTNDCEVFKTSDSGKTWTPIQVQATDDERFYDLALQSQAKGFLVGSKGVYRFSLEQ